MIESAPLAAPLMRVVRPLRINHDVAEHKAMGRSSLNVGQAIVEHYSATTSTIMILLFRSLLLPLMVGASMLLCAIYTALPIVHYNVLRGGKLPGWWV
jgi:hypothetical protein